MADLSSIIPLLWPFALGPGQFPVQHQFVRQPDVVLLLHQAVPRLARHLDLLLSVPLQHHRSKSTTINEMLPNGGAGKSEEGTTKGWAGLVVKVIIE